METVPINMQDIKNILHFTVIDGNNNENLFIEIVYFEKLMENMVKRLPKDKFMENTLKMRRCIRRIALMSSVEKIEAIASGLNATELISMSNQQCLITVLLHFKDIAHLFSQTINYCQQSFGFLLQKLRVGHLLDSLVMSMGTLSRLHVLCKITAMKICSDYQKVFRVLQNAQKETSVNTESTGIPMNLKKWIEKETNIYFTSNRFSKSKKKSSILDQMLESESHQIIPDEIGMAFNSKNFQSAIDTEDIGEPVSRHSTEMGNFSKRRKRKKCS